MIYYQITSFVNFFSKTQVSLLNKVPRVLKCLSAKVSMCPTALSARVPKCSLSVHVPQVLACLECPSDLKFPSSA